MSNLNGNQFKEYYNRQNEMAQANPDTEQVTKTRGLQTATSNIYRPAFSEDYNAPAKPHPAANLDDQTNPGTPTAEEADNY